jgi:hypothetical protein
MSSPKGDLDVTFPPVIQQGPQRHPRSTPSLTLQHFQLANLVIPQMHSSRRDEGTKQTDQADRHSCCTPCLQTSLLNEMYSDPWNARNEISRL